jgi:hypothetical protein
MQTIYLRIVKINTVMDNNLVITGVYITEFQNSTWGRVYVTYTINNNAFYIFKNWIKFDEKTYKGSGEIQNEPAFTWFTPDKQHFYNNYQDVLDGKADHLYLTQPKYKIQYGTPSIILQNLLLHVYSNHAENVNNRRNWFTQQQAEKEIILSPIKITPQYQIVLPLYANREIKLEPILKTLYIFFYQNPQGFLISELYEHQNAIENIYQQLNPNKTKKEVSEKISNLLNYQHNHLNEKLSKIRKQLKEQLNVTLEPYYSISGTPGGIYKIKVAG